MTYRSTLAPWASTAAARRLSSLEAEHHESDPAHVLDTVTATLARYHHRVDDSGLVLYAGTNVLSPAVMAAHDSALSTRPALGWPGEKVQTGVQEIEHLEVIAAQQVAKSMHARYAEVRFLTATMANLACYTAFTQPGDAIAVLSPEAGGHASHQGGTGTASIRGLHVHHLPYSPETLDLDHDAISHFLDAVRPAMVVVGGSVALFPHDLAPLRAAVDRIGAVLLYDASHTAGLIAAGLYQAPLAEGADIVTFSTYKTYAGPAGGAAVTDNPEYAERIADAAYPTLLSNYDPARLGPLAVAAAEATAQTPDWAHPTVDHARELGARLDAVGMSVIGRSRGYTRTHQVVVDVRGFGGGTAAMRRLERAGIYTGAARLPWQHPGTPPEGLRLGTQELVRRGAGTDLIPALADAIVAAVSSDDGDHLRTTEALRARITSDIWGRPTTATPHHERSSPR